MVFLALLDQESSYTDTHLTTVPVVGVLGHRAGSVRFRRRPRQRSRRAPEYSKRVRHRPSDRPVGDDRLCSHDQLSPAADGTAFRHCGPQETVHHRLHDIPRLSGPVHSLKRHRHPHRRARPHGARRLHDAGDLDGDSPFVLPRERARQGPRPPDQRRGFRSRRGSCHRRIRRGRIRLAGGVLPYGRTRLCRHRGGAGLPRPKENGRSDIGGPVRPGGRSHVHGGAHSIPAGYEQRRGDGLARSPNRCGVRCSRRACRVLHVLGATEPQSDARRNAVPS